MEDIYLVYGITDCPACLRAIADLMEAEKEYVFIETDFSPSYRTQLKDTHQWKTFPIVVKLSQLGAESLIGGYTELQAHLEKSVGDAGTSPEGNMCPIIKSSQ